MAGLCGFAQAQTLQGTVTRISDGDTLWIATSPNAKPIKLRLQGIDAPEICQPWGKEAKMALQARLLRQPISAEVKARDDYGRRIVRLSHQNEDVGAWLVSQGHAWSMRGRWDDGMYPAQQKLAKLSKRGLWKASAANEQIEPRAWRASAQACKH